MNKYARVFLKNTMSYISKVINVVSMSTQSWSSLQNFQVMVEDSEWSHALRLRS